MDIKTYRQNAEWYVTSMTFFKKLYQEGFLSVADYEMIEAIVANKYGIPRNSTFRSYFLLILMDINLNIKRVF